MTGLLQGGFELAHLVLLALALLGVLFQRFFELTKPCRGVREDIREFGTLGFRFGDFAYSTDVVTLSEAALDALAGIRIWIVDATREDPHPTHAHLDRTLGWIERLKPERAYLTHMNHTMDYDRLMATLPPGVEPAYDGLVIEV